METNENLIGQRGSPSHLNSFQKINVLFSLQQSRLYGIIGTTRGSAHVHNSSNDRWNPPDENHVKINFDASFNAAERKSISRAIVRDTNGYIMAADTFSHYYVSDPKMVEARTCKQAVSLARDLGFRRVIFEGDAINFISKLNNLTNDLSEINVILKNIHD
ncbi:hypothetical protein V6N13_098605 [Hibiscus sabdariffa]|uniref:RNase H type-1 domain-containing protein n=1 Tax=Hibiscus sabdariffa TaxID=183260 RepID=A0ABR2EEC3_9ROSI